MRTERVAGCGSVHTGMYFISVCCRESTFVAVQAVTYEHHVSVSLCSRVTIIRTHTMKMKTPPHVDLQVVFDFFGGEKTLI